MSRILTGPCLSAIAIVGFVSATRSAEIPFDKFSSSAPLDGEVFLLINANSGRCLSVKDGSKAAGARVVQGPTATEAGAAERWKTVRAGNYYKLINMNSEKVLAVPAAARAKGVRIIQWNDRDDANFLEQRWEFVKSGDHYALKSPSSDMFLAVGAGDKDEMHPVVQWIQTKTAEQVWYVQWIPGAGGK